MYTMYDYKCIRCEICAILLRIFIILWSATGIGFCEFEYIHAYLLGLGDTPAYFEISRAYHVICLWIMPIYLCKYLNSQEKVSFFFPVAFFKDNECSDNLDWRFSHGSRAEIMKRISNTYDDGKKFPLNRIIIISRYIVRIIEVSFAKHALLIAFIRANARTNKLFIFCLHRIARLIFDKNRSGIGLSYIMILTYLMWLTNLCIYNI